MMELTRREWIRGAAVAAIGGTMNSSVSTADSTEAPIQRKGNIRHSVSRWCYNKIPMEEFCAFCKRIGIESVELLGPADFPVLQRHGLVCAMVNSHGIAKGLNRVEHHAECLAKIREAIDAASAAGYPNVICFSGNREGISDEEGLENCARALKQIVGYAEQKNVTLCMELLNSKRNHKDYQCDRTAWGVELCKRVGSPNLKLLYDIYHMQIMEGDIIATIRENIQYIGHVHTGGVPGRNEIDETQELNYPAIMKALVAAGYKGFVGQEFIPKRDPLTSLRQAIDLCDV
jgi:hydroxypyruvate isomerase